MALAPDALGGPASSRFRASDPPPFRLVRETALRPHLKAGRDMKSIRYDHELARELLPLLAAIGEEIEERSERLEELEAKIEACSSQPSHDERQVEQWVAEAAAHKRGLRMARDELEKLGCSVVGMEPLTFRIPGRKGPAKRSFVWQAGDPALR